MDIKRLFELSGITLTEAKYQELRSKINEDADGADDEICVVIRLRGNEVRTSAEEMVADLQAYVEDRIEEDAIELVSITIEETEEEEEEDLESDEMEDDAESEDDDEEEEEEDD